MDPMSFENDNVGNTLKTTNGDNNMNTPINGSAKGTMSPPINVPANGPTNSNSNANGTQSMDTMMDIDPNTSASQIEALYTDLPTSNDPFPNLNPKSNLDMSYDPANDEISEDDVESEEDYEPQDDDMMNDDEEVDADDVDDEQDEDYETPTKPFSSRSTARNNLKDYVQEPAHSTPEKSRIASGVSNANILPSAQKRTHKIIDYSASTFNHSPTYPTRSTRSDNAMTTRNSSRNSNQAATSRSSRYAATRIVYEQPTRSTRTTRSRNIKSYAEDIDFEDLSEEEEMDDFEQEEEVIEIQEEDEEVIESILAVRDATKVVANETPVSSITNENTMTDIKEEEPAVADEALENSEDEELAYEYLVKFQGRSYRMCTWLSKEQIEEQHNGATKIERFHKKYGYPEDFENVDGVYFNPVYEDVDRIIAEANIEGKTIFLVKWKALGYDQCTWEFENSLEKDHLAIEAFRRRDQTPRVSELRVPPRPPASEFAQVSNEIMAFKDGNELRPYQIEGLNWMVFSYFNRVNTILADEMGLGKTIQSVSILYYLNKIQHNRGPFLILAPLSTVEHWKREIEEWTEMNCIVFHGSKEARNTIKDYEFYYHNQKTGKTLRDVYKFNVMITTYEMCLQEKSTLSRIHWQYLVVDEGHRLKNKNSKLLDTLLNFKVEHKLLLTGTPIQNDIGELYTLLNYLNPGRFHSREEFIEKFGNLQNKDQVEELHNLIKPYLLRRMKEDVEKSIPPKEEIVVEMIPTTYQKTYYKAILEGKREFLRQGVNKKSQMPRLVNILMEIRKVCNHPFLIPGAEAQITRSLPQNEVNELLIRSSSKLIFTDKLLKHLKENGHKVLIFSQMVRVLHILEDYLNYRNYKYVRLDGSIKGDVRQEAIDSFNDPSKDIFAFLISTRAGGVGINLMAADTVIIFDSDFNPQNDIQAQARCHRIGQQKEVKVYRLLTKDTKEFDLFQRANRKLGLDRAVLNNISSVDYSGSKAHSSIGLNNDEIDVLLKHGAYVAYRDDSEEEKMLVEGDIDTILKRSSKVVRWDQDTKKDKGVSHFSKASFNFDDKSVDINDKDFWAKVLPQARDVHGLNVILNTEGSLSTEEEREQFFNDLSTLVDRAIDQMSKFEWSAEHDDLGGLLARIMYSSKFSTIQRDTARDWLEKVDKRLLRLKEREDIEDVMQIQPGVGLDELQTPHVKKGGWYKSEREKLFRGLTNLGWGKWEVFKERKCENKTIYEIRSMSEAILQSLIDECKRREHLEVLIEKEATSATAENKDEKIFKRRNYTKDINMLRSLLMASTVDAEHLEDEKKSKLEIKVKFEEEYTILPGKAVLVTLPEDKSLLAPACRIEIIELASDKESELRLIKNKCVRMIELTEEQWNSDKFKVPLPGYRGSFRIRLIGRHYSGESDVLVVRGVHPQCAETDFIQKIEKNHKTYIKRLRFSNNLTKVLNHYDHKIQASDIPDLQIKSPTLWWDKDCDVDMLIGIASHGAGKFLDLKIDQTLCFQRKLDEFANSMRTRRERDNVDRSWPQTQVLSKRIELLVDLMLKNVGLWESYDSAGTVSMSREWAKTERIRFIRDMSLYGGHPARDGEPNYGKIISSAKLTKSPQYMKIYLKAFLKMCARVSEMELTEDEKAEEDEEFLSVEKDVEEVTANVAKRILERTRLMSGLAKYVFEDVKENISKFHRHNKKKGSGLPLWYKVNTHDLELISGVQKHGLDARAIMDDDNSLFASLDEDQKRKMRDSLLIKRLDDFVKFMEKLHKCGSPTHSKSAWDCTPKRQKLGLEKSPKVKKEKKEKKDKKEKKEKKSKKEKKERKEKKEKKERKEKKENKEKENTSDSEKQKKQSTLPFGKKRKRISLDGHDSDSESKRARLSDTEPEPETSNNDAFLRLSALSALSSLASNQFLQQNQEE